MGRAAALVRGSAAPDAAGGEGCTSGIDDEQPMNQEIASIAIAGSSGSRSSLALKVATGADL